MINANEKKTRGARYLVSNKLRKLHQKSWHYIKTRGSRNDKVPTNHLIIQDILI